MVHCTSIHSAEKRAIASFLSLLIKDSSITNIVPTRHMDSTKQMLNSINNLKANESADDIVNIFVQNAKLFSPELGDLLLISTKLSSNSKPKEYLITFLVYLVKRIDDIREQNIVPSISSEIKKYNPPRDAKAYYFSESGHQIRNVRRFEIDQRQGTSKQNFDDNPNLICNKSFPTVSKKGMTYLFLWFCPAHGHCYGFHVIPGSEGRKDAASSLYSFLEKAPDVVFYDFACSLDEYTKNRENGYFNNTTFFHDIFHGYTHKCSNVFKSNRLLGFNGINTSICEQFNSFIQCIKASSKLMTQEHFMFYLQFFIHQWNMQRKKSFLKKLSIVIAGYK